MKKKLVIIGLFTIALIGCGGGSREESKSKIPAEVRGDLTDEEFVKGIGPVKSIELEVLNPVLADTGAKIFSIKCVACHKMDARLVGPPLEGVTTRRSPEFIMNMILNPEEMVKRHPQVKEMLATYFVPMTFQNVTREDARAILEYLRSNDQDLNK